jgi:hypothetical protein
MNWIWGSIAALLFLQGVTWAGEKIENSPGGHEREKYRYEAVPIGGGADKRESSEIALIDEDRGVEYISRTIRPEDLEEITIHMDRDGRFISGLRTTSTRQNERLQ